MNENGAGRTTAKQGGSRSGRAGALPPVELIRRSDIVAALDAARQKPNVDGIWSFDGTASTEEENRLRILAHLANDPRRTRPALVADAATVTRLDELARTAPNAARPLALVRSLAALSAATGRPLRVPPLLLLGPPGTGKTRIATKLAAAALETGELILHGTAINDDHAWIGTPYNWRGCGTGGVAKALLAGPTAGPVVVTDEAEKVGAYDRRDFPLDCLLPLLEPSTAAVARDKYLDVPMRCDGVIWVFCCNTLNGLSRPFLDRCVVLDVPDLVPDERTAAAEAMLDEVLVAYGLPPGSGRSTGAAALAARHGLRRARTLLLTALGLAVAAGRKLPRADDVRAAADLIGDHGEAPRREPAGFVLHR